MCEGIGGVGCGGLSRRALIGRWGRKGGGVKKRRGEGEEGRRGGGEEGRRGGGEEGRRGGGEEVMGGKIKNVKEVSGERGKGG